MSPRDYEVKLIPGINKTVLRQREQDRTVIVAVRLDSVSSKQLMEELAYGEIPRLSRKIIEGVLIKDLSDGVREVYGVADDLDEHLTSSWLGRLRERMRTVFA